MRSIARIFGSKSHYNRNAITDLPFAAPPSDDAPFNPTTTAIQDILLCCKTLAVYHSVTEFTVSNYPEIIGSALGSIYIREPRTRIQCNSMACVLALHCGIASAKSFLNVLRNNAFETGIHVTDSNRLIIEDGILIIGMMDMYGLGRKCAMNGDMEFSWNPFEGPACWLWSYGYRGVALDSPEVIEALEDYAERLIDID